MEYVSEHWIKRNIIYYWYKVLKTLMIVTLQCISYRQTFKENSNNDSDTQHEKINKKASNMQGYGW